MKPMQLNTSRANLDIIGLFGGVKYTELNDACTSDS